MSKTIPACALGVLVVTLGSTAYAQTSATTTPADDEPRTLVGNHPSIGGYGGVEVKSTPIMGTTSALVGGQGGIVLGHRFVLGGAGYGLTTPIDIPQVLQTNGASTRMAFGYGGVRLAYILVPRSLFHTGFAVLVGGGGVGWNAATGGYAYEDGEWKATTKARSDAFFVVEPQVEVEMNVHKFVRVALTGSYRFVRGIQTDGLKDSDFRGASFGGVVKLGMF